MSYNTSDLTLLLLLFSLAGGAIKGRKRLQKIVCIMKHKYKIPFSFEFIPYHYGPYSEELVDAIDTLKAANLIEERGELLSDYIVQYNYSLTSSSESLSRKILGRTEDRNVEKMRELLGTLQLLPTSKLVKMAKELTY